MKQEQKICDFEKKEQSKVKRLLQVFQKDRGIKGVYFSVTVERT